MDFGEYRYVCESGREGDWFLIGLSPRNQDLALYLMSGFERHGPLMKKLGKYETSRSCLYAKSFADIDLPAIETMPRESVARMRKR